MKSIILKQTTLIAFILLFFSNCDFEWLAMDKWYGIDVYNNSSQTIYIWAAYILPDTLLPQEKPQLIEFSPTKKYPDIIRDNQVNDEKFKRLEHGEILTVFILNKNVVESNSWDSIRINNMILRRLEYTKDMKGIYYP